VKFDVLGDVGVEGGGGYEVLIFACTMPRLEPFILCASPVPVFSLDRRNQLILFVQQVMAAVFVSS
jgi:hypothetical protein